MWQKNRVAPIYCRQMTATWGKINLACLPLWQILPASTWVWFGGTPLSYGENPSKISSGLPPWFSFDLFVIPLYNHSGLFSWWFLNISHPKCLGDTPVPLNINPHDLRDAAQVWSVWPGFLSTGFAANVVTRSGFCDWFHYVSLTV
jgi:hypothetical protein